LKVYLAGRVAAESDRVVIDERRFPGRQGRLLFAYLVVGQGRAIPRDELADVLWEGSPPVTWEKALGVLASKLRGLLGENRVHEPIALTAAFGCYRLDLPEGSWVDVVAAEQAADEAEAALARADVEGARGPAALAESLVRGSFLPGDDGTWVEEKRRELAGVRARVLNVLAEACLRAGESQESVRWAEQAIDAEPFRESGYRLLMAAHIAAGNRAEALRVYERCRRLLAEELGAFPSPETEGQYRDLLETPPGRVAEAAPSTAFPPTGEGWRSLRRRAAVVVGLVLLLGVTAGILAVMSRGGPPPTVVPNSLIRIDPHTLRVTQVVPVDTQPDLVVAAGGFVWVTSHVLRDVNSGALRNAGDRALTRVDPATGKAMVVAGLSPCGLTADPSGDVWVANCYRRATGSRDNVVRVGAKTLDFVKTWPVPGGDGFYRGLAYGGGSLWVGNIEGGDVGNPKTVTEIDPQTGARGTIRPKRPAGAMAWADGYGDLWMANFDYGTVTRLHVSTDTLDPVGSRLVNPAFPLVDGDTVWVGDWAGPRVANLRAVGAPRARRIVFPAHNRSAGVWDLAAGAGSIWATTPRDGTLWRIDSNTNVVTRIPVPYLPTGVAADDNDVWVTVRGR
jgi:SARP family transcriptional regulator, regulator of embCAB operon